MDQKTAKERGKRLDKLKREFNIKVATKLSKMKIREIYTVVRERPIEDLEEASSRRQYMDDEGLSYCLYVDIQNDEEISLKFQVDKGDGWEDFDPEK